MNSEIQIRENPLFGRKEIILNVESEKTPSMEEAGKIISEKTKTPPENINVLKIDGSFGKREFKIHALVYNSKKEKEKMDVRTRKQRKAEKEQAKKEAEEKAKEAEEEKKAAEKQVEEKEKIK